MKSNLVSKGFTLTELMVTIAIMGIMAAIALPNMSSFVKQARVTNRANQIANLFRYAQGEAVRTGSPVVICGDTIRSDGRPAGVCNANIFDNAHADSAHSGLKAFIDQDSNGTYGAASDVHARTISINGNNRDKTVELALQYCGTTTDCVDAAAPQQMIFFPNGQFGVQQGAGLRNAAVGSRYAQFLLRDAAQSAERRYWQYVVISPSGKVAVCKDDSSEKQLCGS